MRARWPIFTALTMSVGSYLVYPYATLWRLDAALRGSDTETLRTLVDWHAVREGLTEDICDSIEDDGSPAHASASDAKGLAPFGSGFLRGVTGNMLYQAVTPEAIASMTRSAAGETKSDAYVSWAFFRDPTRFAVDVRTDGTPEPIRVEMALDRLRWRVNRVWLPSKMLSRMSSGT